MLKKLSLYISVAVLLCAGLDPQTRAATNPCDYSFIVRQPLFDLVAPEEGSTQASLSTVLGVATDDGDLNTIKQIQLVPDKGATIQLPAKFKTVEKSRRTIATMALPQLSPSTTYDVVLTVRTVSAPQSCPRQLTEHIARFTTESATSLDALALEHAKSQPPSGGPLSGATIFENALQEMRGFDYPDYVSYLVTMHSTIDSKPFVESFRSLVRTSDDLVSTHAVPVATTNKPENPWGWNINIPILSSLFRHERKGNYQEPFGVPQMSAIYAFGLRPPAPTLFPGARPKPTDPDVKTLGRIRTVARFYDATLLGVEPYRSRYVYHLKLQPLGDPSVYRVREAWVDTQAFVIWKLRSAGIFETGPATTIPWDVTYTVVDGHWFIADETTASTVRTGGLLAGSPVTAYNGISYTFSDFSFPTSLSELDFFNELKTQAIQF